MSEGGKEGIWKTIITGVVVALIAGGSAPWWWDRFSAGGVSQSPPGATTPADASASDPLQVAELRLYLTRCSDGIAEACNSAGVWIGDGKGAPFDFERSATLYQKACELGSGVGCRNYGRRLLIGKGVAVDATSARRYFVRACDLGYERGCRELAQLAP